MKVNTLMIISMLLIIPTTYAENDTPCPVIDTQGSVNRHDVFWSDEYYPYLIEGRKSIIRINITLSGNWSLDPSIEMGVKNNISCYKTEVENSTPCDIPSMDKSSYRDSQGNNYTNFRGVCYFYVPLDTKNCQIYPEIFGINISGKGYGPYCKLTVSYNGSNISKNVITEVEYLTIRANEISQRQTEIMEKQANISQQQTEIMEKQTWMIIVAAFIGVFGAIYGAKIGADRAIKGHLKLQQEQLYAEKMSKVSEPICNQLSQTLEDNIAKIEKSESSESPTNNRWGNVKDSYEFKIAPRELQDELTDYFNNKIAKQMKRWRDIDDDIGRLLWGIFNKRAKEKGLPTEMEIGSQIKKLEYPNFSLSGFCGHAMEYSHRIGEWLLDRKKTDLNLIFRTFPKLKQFHDKKNGPYAHQQEKETINTYNVIIDSILELQDNLTDKIKEELGEYRQNNKTILEESEKLNKKLKEIMQKYGH